MSTMLVVGGGFFGARLALLLRRLGSSVILLERERTLLTRASYANQARVHGGYHYPRSILTAFRSRINAPHFQADYAEAIDRSFAHYYGVAREGSRVSAEQFRRFCERIGAPLRPAPSRIRALFDPSRVEAVFEVEEYAFDATILASRVHRDLSAAGITLHLGHDVQRISFRPGAARPFLVDALENGRAVSFEADSVFNCTYSAAGTLLRRSGFPAPVLRLELAELALIQPPSPLEGAAVTIVDGPFFSCMPFPAGKLHSLSHVRYTPHASWRDDGSGKTAPPPWVASPRSGGGTSHGDLMLRDAARYVPSLAEARLQGSLWEVKALRPENDVDDGRPILLQEVPNAAGLWTVLGAKIDTIYDLEERLISILTQRAAHATD